MSKGEKMGKADSTPAEEQLETLTNNSVLDYSEVDKIILNPLTIDRVLELWSKTYNTDGKPDWSHLFPYYHPEIIFQDSIQKIVGIQDFKTMCDRLTRRCKQLRMDIRSIAQGNADGADFFIMDWKMTMSFRKSPSTPIFGSTWLLLHEDGRIIEQRDYYDLWGDIFNGIPGFNRMYRKFMRRFFG